MQQHDSSNHIFQTAVNFINQTDRPVFLTGKAGTGKTTFLKYIKSNTYKKTAVVAPTGVAAINAGGVTMHSFFQLPFGPFVPVKSGGWSEGATNVQGLLKNIRFNSDKRELLRELELLIIDEVSMVRADMLDAVDTVLRHFRNRLHEPFGGVQVLYIGDLFQLPPVAKNDEWRILNEYYDSPFFFDAQAIKQSPPMFIELKKIYRQSESSFINILNNVRNNVATRDDLDELHTRYLPGFMAPRGEAYITLTSHNAKADEINSTHLRNLSGRSFTFKGEVKGEFNENALPVEMNLQMKEGAQIMFIKNDKGEIRRYYNGKLGTIKRIDGDNNIVVGFPNEPGEIVLEKEVWKNIRYSFNREANKIDEDEVGSYTQYPIRLAWAITIHKSQGLTFEKAIIDAGDSFAPGQVYVALSRLTSLDGMVLRSRILPQAISTDERVIKFSKEEMSEDALRECLRLEQREFISRSLLGFFNWDKLLEIVKDHYQEYEHRNIPDKDKTVLWFRDNILEKVKEQNRVAVKFRGQLEQLLSESRNDFAFVHQRAKAAADYFMQSLDEVILLLKVHREEVKIKKRSKKYLKELDTLLLMAERKRQEVKSSVAIAEAMMNRADNNDLLQLVEAQLQTSAPPAQYPLPASKEVKAPKGETQRISLQMFREGKSVEEIARLREYATGTIETHLAGFILTGEVDVKELVNEQKMEQILKTMDEVGTAAATPVKERLGNDYSYAEIRAVMYYRKKLETTS